MPQLDTATYLPQLFWLIVAFSAMFGVFVGMFLPKISRILQKRICAFEQAGNRVENLKDLNLSLQKNYDDKKSEILKKTQDQIDTSLASVRAFHEKRIEILEAEIQKELNAVKINDITKDEVFSQWYQTVVDEAAERIMQRLGIEEAGKKNGC